MDSDPEAIAAIAGLILTAIGVILAIVPPKRAAEASGPRSRYVAGIAVILIGTALQIYATWPL